MGDEIGRTSRDSGPVRSCLDLRSNGFSGSELGFEPTPCAWRPPSPAPSPPTEGNCIIRGAPGRVMPDSHENAVPTGDLRSVATAVPTKRGPPTFSSAVVCLKGAWGTIVKFPLEKGGKAALAAWGVVPFIKRTGQNRRETTP